VPLWKVFRREYFPVHAYNLTTIPRSSDLLRVLCIDYATPTSLYCTYCMKYQRTQKVWDLLTIYKEHNPLYEIIVPYLVKKFLAVPFSQQPNVSQYYQHNEFRPNTLLLFFNFV
jgi:hypothetical protein